MQMRGKREGRGAQRVKHARGVRHVQGEDDIFLLFLALSLARVSLLAHVQPLRTSLAPHARFVLALIHWKTQRNDACSAG